jgi:hypothetical protein
MMRWRFNTPTNLYQTNVCPTNVCPTSLCPTNVMPDQCMPNQCMPDLRPPWVGAFSRYNAYLNTRSFSNKQVCLTRLASLHLWSRPPYLPRYTRLQAYFWMPTLDMRYSVNKKMPAVVMVLINLPIYLIRSCLIKLPYHEQRISNWSRTTTNPIRIYTYGNCTHLTISSSD